MKEWAAIPPANRDHWDALAAEALHFVGTQA